MAHRVFRPAWPHLHRSTVLYRWLVSDRYAVTVTALGENAEVATVLLLEWNRCTVQPILGAAVYRRDERAISVHPVPAISHTSYWSPSQHRQPRREPRQRQSRPASASPKHLGHLAS